MLTITIQTPKKNELVLDLIQSLIRIGADINEFLTHYKETSYKVIDCNGFGDYTPSNEELENIELINKIAWIIEEYEDVACILLNNNYSIDRAQTMCENNYYGFYESNVEYAKDYISNTYGIRDFPEELESFMDWEEFGMHLLDTQDLIIIDDYGGGFYVFFDDL